MASQNMSEEDLAKMLKGSVAREVNPRSRTSEVRHPKGVKMGELCTKDAAKRNQSTEGQGNVKSGSRTPCATKCDCWRYEYQVCDICQGTGGEDERERGGANVTRCEQVQPSLGTAHPTTRKRATAVGSNPAPSPIMLELLLIGQLCSGKNQVQLLWRNGKVCKYPNKTFTNWRSRAHIQIEAQQLPAVRTPTITVPVVLTCHYTPGDCRTRDVTGQLDALFHLLVYAKVLKDDGLIYENHWFRQPLNRRAPQVTILIRNWEEVQP